MNAGSEALEWTGALDTSAPPILSLSTNAPSNLLGGGASHTINVTVDTTGLVGGLTLTTSMTINAVDRLNGRLATGSPVVVPITVNVVPVAMQLSTTNLSFTTTQGNNPGIQSITIANTHGNMLTWTAGPPSQTWLTIDPTHGSDAPGATSSVKFSVDAMNLATGTYYATVTIAPSVGAPVTVTITLTIV